MEKKIALLLALVLLLAGCAAQQTPTDGTTMGTVPDLFTQPTTVPQATTKPTDTTPTVPDRDIPERLGLGFESEEITYTGGELHIKVMVTGIGYSNVGLGLYLFVDGHPQPYRTAENETTSYMHTFYPKDDEVNYYEFIFTPVSGKAGETVDIHVMEFADPTYFLGDGEFGAHVSCLSDAASIRFEATPQQQELPTVTDVLKSWSCTYVDVTEAEIGDWTAEQMERQVGFRYTINDKERSGRFYGVTAEDTVKIRYEAWGMPYVTFGFVIFMDNQPVSVAAEDIMLFDIKNGQKTVIEAEISLENFDGSSVVIAALVPRNSQSCGVENNAWLEETGTSYFSSADSYEDLLEQINNGEK